MEYLIISCIAFICVVQAYLLGAKHGMATSKKIIVKPFNELRHAVNETIKPEPKEDTTYIDELMSYSYEKALESVKNEHNRRE